MSDSRHQLTITADKLVKLTQQVTDTLICVTMSGYDIYLMVGHTVIHSLVTVNCVLTNFQRRRTKKKHSAFLPRFNNSNYKGVHQIF